MGLHNTLSCLLLWILTGVCFAQGQFPHRNAHAHNDYEHVHPLKDALQNGFISVEADVHLRKGKLQVAHNHTSDQSPLLEELYMKPLDSILSKNNGQIYSAIESPVIFYLMIDVKTEEEVTYQAIKTMLVKYPALQKTGGPFKIFLSGNRPIQTIRNEGTTGIGVDGRPGDLGKGFSSELMPVVSDHYKNWSHWNGKARPTGKDLAEIKALALRVHAEGKKLRLWSIPDNELAWESLLAAGVDLINTDKLEQLNKFLTRRGL